MERFTTITSFATPITIKDVDTDMIIPAEFLVSTSRDGYAKNLFVRLREGDANFPLNQDRYQGSQLLIADSNFGCGSSREHAVWALMGWGFRVIVGKSFADIFTSNSGKNGLLLVKLPEAEVNELLSLSATERLEVTVNLLEQFVEWKGKRCSFEYNDFQKHCLIEGLDDIDYILSKAGEIEKFRKAIP